MSSSRYVLLNPPSQGVEDPLFAQYDEMRVSWVRHIFGWLPPATTDLDELDSHPATVQLGVCGNNPGDSALLGGIRLTPVSTLEESLSWKMVQDILGPESDSVRARLFTHDDFALGLADGRVYEVTRAFPSAHPHHAHYAAETIYRLFGAGMSYCHHQHGGSRRSESFYWFFVSNAPLRAFLEAASIPFHLLNEPKNQNDLREQSFVLFVDMDEAHGHVKERAERGSEVHQLMLDAVHEATQELGLNTDHALFDRSRLSIGQERGMPQQ